jgi:hypothetical protein
MILTLTKYDRKKLPRNILIYSQALFVAKG